jgi:sugar phosphate isomerase/epimerase
MIANATSRPFSLAYLTAAPLSPPDTISLAADIGYSHVGLRLLPAAPGGDFAPLMTDAALLRETQARMKATGVAVFDVEIVRIGAGFKAADLARFLETCAALGAQAILVAGDDPDEARLTASFVAFCDAARPFGLTADLEFMPWTKVPDCKTARRVVETAARPNGRILVDALHAARSTTTLADLADLPRSLLSYVQICDAPAEIPATLEGLLHTARQARLLPGTGGIDLKAMFAALPADLPMSIELPNDELKARHGVEEWCRMALAATRQTLAS